MEKQEALSLFEQHCCHNIIVEHKKSGVQYILNRDIVEAKIKENDDHVYGFFVKPHPRSKQDHKWFNLSSVNFVSKSSP